MFHSEDQNVRKWKVLLSSSSSQELILTLNTNLPCFDWRNVLFDGLLICTLVLRRGSVRHETTNSINRTGEQEVRYNPLCDVTMSYTIKSSLGIFYFCNLLLGCYHHHDFAKYHPSNVTTLESFACEGSKRHRALHLTPQFFLTRSTSRRDHYFDKGCTLPRHDHSFYKGCNQRMCVTWDR